LIGSVRCNYPSSDEVISKLYFSKNPKNVIGDACSLAYPTRQISLSLHSHNFTNPSAPAVKKEFSLTLTIAVMKEVWALGTLKRVLLVEISVTMIFLSVPTVIKCSSMKLVIIPFTSPKCILWKTLSNDFFSKFQRTTYPSWDPVNNCYFFSI